jgi:hypothetical protein
MNRYSIALAVLALAVLVGLATTGCDETGPLVRTGVLAGVVRDSAAAYISGVPVCVIYEVPTPPVAKAGGSTFAEAGLRPVAEVGPPEGLYVERNYPNPFAAQTTIGFGLPDSGAVTLELLDVMGEHVATLVDTSLTAGAYAYVWSAAGGPALPNGYSLAVLSWESGEAGGTAISYGLLHNASDPEERSPCDLTDGAGEFTIPLAEVASGIRIPLATEAGPEIVGHVVVPEFVQVEIDHDGQTESRSVQLQDMSAWYYLEFMLP